MKLLRVKVDIGGTRNEEAWTGMKHFEEVPPHEEIFRLFCGHDANQPHPAGEWGEATLKFEDFIAEYAIAHYLKQPRVIDANIEPDKAPLES
ncbi:MAG TPA: hypothetical protein VFA54_06405 [Bryobacterales bacterium]|nr:hypothetical protein [Bryobacterales bacterium]